MVECHEIVGYVRPGLVAKVTEAIRKAYPQISVDAKPAFEVRQICVGCETYLNVATLNTIRAIVKEHNNAI